jgi:hypothetical protein
MGVAKRIGDCLDSEFVLLLVVECRLPETTIFCSRPAFEYSVTFASSKQQNDNLPPCNVEMYYALHVGTVAILFTY